MSCPVTPNMPNHRYKYIHKHFNGAFRTICKKLFVFHFSGNLNYFMLLTLGQGDLNKRGCTVFFPWSVFELGFVWIGRGFVWIGRGLFGLEGVCLDWRGCVWIGGGS